MPRVSQPIQISEIDRQHMSAMLEHADSTLKERIQIILSCADEPSNKKVAQALNVTEHTVAKWKEAFRINGLAGLEDVSGKGRKPKATVENLDTLILSKVESTETELTVQALAKEFGVSNYQVSKILSEKNISLARKHTWSFQTQETCSSADVETIGLYLSPTECLILGCWHPYGIVSNPGMLTTRSSLLANRYSQADYVLPLQDAIVECSYIDNDESIFSADSSNTMFVEFIEDYLNTIGNSVIPEVQYRMFLWSQTPFHSRKVLPSNTQIICCTDVKDVLTKFHSWAGSLTTSAHLYDVEFLNETISSFYEKIKPGAETFSWRKTIVSVGNENEPVHLQLLEDETARMPINEWLENLIQGKVEGDYLQAGYIVYVKDKDGISYRLVPAKDILPAASEFGFDSEKAFLNGMNQLEAAIIKVRNEAGLAATDLYLDRVKKK